MFCPLGRDWPIQTWIAPLLLGASSVLALTGGFTFMSSLRLLVDNMAVPYSTAAALLAASRFVDALWATAVSPVLDRAKLLPLALGAGVTAVLLRIVLVSIILLGPAGQSWQDAMVMPLLMLITSADGTIGRTVELQLQKTADSTRAFATKGETTLSTRLFSYTYALDNLGMFVAGSIFDLARTYAPTLATANAIMQVLALASSVLAVLLVLSAWRFTQFGLYTAVPTTDSGEEEPQPPPSFRTDVGHLLRDPTLWRFTAFSICLTGARSIMVHMETTLTEVMMRLFGPTVHFAAIQSINPFLVILGSPLIQHWLSNYNGYWVITAGTAVSVLSLLPIASIAPPNSITTSPWAAYVPYALFVILFSVGECIWSARLRSYSFSVAPEAKRASYLALASVPLIGVRFIAAWHSGWMVDFYCPASSATHCNARALWAMVMGFGAFSPVLLFLGRRWLDPNRRRVEQKMLLSTPSAPLLLKG